MKIIITSPAPPFMAAGTLRRTKLCVTTLLATAALATSALDSAHAQTVDPSTIAGKVLAGYQGWFRCAGDGSPYNNYSHWTYGNAPFTLNNISVDAYPDVTGMDPASLCDASPFTIQEKPAYLFTSFALQTEWIF